MKITIGGSSVMSTPKTFFCLTAEYPATYLHVIE